MPDRDAFGNELPRAGSAPARQGLPGLIPGAPAPPRARRKTVRRLLTTAVVGVIALGAVGSLLDTSEPTGSGATGDLDEAMRRFDEAVKAIPDRSPALPGSGGSPRPPALGDGSLIRSERFGAAVALMRRDGAERVSTFSVTPASVDASLADDAGEVRYLQVGPDGRLNRYPGRGKPFGSSTVSLADIDPGAPERLVRAGARQAGAPVDDVSAVTLFDEGDGPQWLASFQDGGSVLGDRLGRVVPEGG